MTVFVSNTRSALSLSYRSADGPDSSRVTGCMEPTSEPSRTISAARAHLERGYRFEQAGTLERALEAYQDALAARPTPLEEAEGRLRLARVLRTLADWERSRQESREAVRIAE